VILVSALIVVTSFLVWVNTTNPIMPQAEAALQSSSTVMVTRTGGYISFAPTASEPTVGIVLYPGGRVLAEAYAPLARAIAEQGYLAAIVFAPMNLAILNVNAADQVIADFPSVTTWAVGGHSLGAATATLYVQNNLDVRGLVIMASFPPNDALRERADLRVVSIYGTNDGLARAEDVRNSSKDLPQNARFVPIEGGNHAQFGYYGVQVGDNQATISHEEQTTQIVTAIVALLDDIAPAANQSE
jgi:pimeloyl-ACP methyl ester carboxylesterase